jgi:hypothetical protein
MVLDLAEVEMEEPLFLNEVQLEMKQQNLAGTKMLTEMMILRAPSRHGMSNILNC